MSLRDAINNATPEQIRAAQMIAEARAERDAARAALEELREAARALLRTLLETLEDRALWGCDCAGLPGAEECEGIATARAYDRADTTDLCDSCAAHLDRSHLEDFPHASALRTLRKLLEVPS